MAFEPITYKRQLEDGNVGWLLSFMATGIAVLTKASTVLVTSGNRWAHVASNERHTDAGVVFDLSEHRWFTWCSPTDVQIIVTAWHRAGAFSVGRAIISPAFFEQHAGAPH